MPQAKSITRRAKSKKTAASNSRIALSEQPNDPTRSTSPKKRGRNKRAAKNDVTHVSNQTSQVTLPDPREPTSPVADLQNDVAGSEKHDGELLVTLDRRHLADRRSGEDRRKEQIPVAVERRQLDRRAKVPRRRQIDPTTCERDYTPEEIEFMIALDEYKRTSGRMFPTCSEILEVIKKLGYEKRVSPAAQQGETVPSDEVSPPATGAANADGSALPVDSSHQNRSSIPAAPRLETLSETAIPTSVQAIPAAPSGLPTETGSGV